VAGEWPAGRTRPRRGDAASAVPLDDDLALYDDVGWLLILLNASAAAVWRLCDGATSVDDIVRTCAEAKREDASVIAGDVRRTLSKLAELGLVVDADGTNETVGESPG
jgi:Coenzyme PQQ synthesis protein D (PqqD)